MEQLCVTSRPEMTFLVLHTYIERHYWDIYDSIQCTLILSIKLRASKSTNCINQQLDYKTTEINFD